MLLSLNLEEKQLSEEKNPKQVVQSGGYHYKPWRGSNLSEDGSLNCWCRESKRDRKNVCERKKIV